MSDKLFNCNDLGQFIKSIIKVLPYSGASMSRFYLCEYNRAKFITKLCAYRKSAYELYDKKGSTKILNHTDAEIAIINILKKYIIDANVSSCIIEIVHTKICNNINKLLKSSTNCDQLLTKFNNENTPENDIFTFLCKYNDLIKDDLAYNKCAFIVMDKCDITLETFIHKIINTSIHTILFKSILFHIIYVFYAINKIFPKFRHYDLHTENILLKFDYSYTVNHSNPKFTQYTIDNTDYYVPYFGIIPKIIDFGFSVLPEKNILSSAIYDKIHMHYRADNDLLLLFYWIDNSIFNINHDINSPILDILRQLDPTTSYIHYYVEYIKKIEHTIPTYKDMVTNDVWKDYKSFKVSPQQIYKRYDPV